MQIASIVISLVAIAISTGVLVYIHRILVRMCDLCEDRKETGMEESRKCVKIEMDTSELDDVLKKVEKLREVLLEAKTLLDELASKEIDLRIKL